MMTSPRHAESARALRRKKTAPYILLIPSVVILLIGMGYPVGWQLVTSFQKYGLAQQFGAPATWTAFGNYAEFVTNPETLTIIIRSVVFCVVAAAVTVVIGLLLAMLMKAIPTVPRIILQVAMLLAWATPVVATMTVWTWLFDPRRGVINYVLDLIPGVEMNRYNWLANPVTFFLVAGIIVVWMSVPFVAFSIYAGLTQVSDDVGEAAQLDGATGFQRLRYITLPMIRPVLMIVLLLNLVWDLRVFTQIKILQDSGGKSTDFDLLGTYIFKLGTGAQNFGMAAAVSVFVLVLTVALSSFYIRMLLKEDEQ